MERDGASDKRQKKNNPFHSNPFEKHQRKQFRK
jgi:hypothetical protein